GLDRLHPPFAPFAFDQQDVAFGTAGRDHVQVEGDLGVPGAEARMAFPAFFVHLAEAPVGLGAGWKAEFFAVLPEVVFGFRVTEVIDDSHSDALAAVFGPAIRIPEFLWAEAAAGPGPFVFGAVRSLRRRRDRFAFGRA